jgi:hypothetical protein
MQINRRFQVNCISQSLFRDQSLMALHPGNMSNTARNKLKRKFDRTNYAFGCLIGKAVHEVEVEACHPWIAHSGRGLGRLMEGLHALDGFLNIRIKVLAAQARAAGGH